MADHVNLSRLKLLYDRVQGSPYKLGAKWPLGADSAEVRGTPVDCSGFVRWLLHRSGVHLPDGSQQQLAYVRDVLEWRPVEYDNLRYTVNDPMRLFIAFRKDRRDARGHYRYGHVWLVRKGKTIECYSRVGVGSLPWQRRKAIADACYEVPVRR